MSDERLKRRRFLADALFAGSAAAAAGLLSRWAMADREPTPSPSPSPVVRGEPQASPAQTPPPPKGEVHYSPPDQPPTGGKPMAPPK